MTRSRKRKLERVGIAMTGIPLASTAFVGAPLANAQETADSVTLEEVVVSAQKRDENLQSVPLSITALGTSKLEELHVASFADYAKFLPSVSFTTIGPGASSVYMRGVASGENSNHSGPLPTVGIYLDEQPITTIQGALDVHIYDIARVEALAGPQGTLYGASSQAGTLRIITNKPDPTGFKSGYDLSLNSVEKGGTGYIGEAFLNLPISSNTAVRLVGWREHDAGYIDNVAGTRTFPTAGITQNNFSRAKNDYNDVDTVGGRAALRVDLNESWTITPAVMAQNQKTNGAFGYDSKIGDLKLQHYFPENSKDKWWQAAFTVEGKIGNFDLVYSGAYLKRDFDSNTDYSDYSYFYDTLSGYTVYNDDGALIDPSQHIIARDGFKKHSHELRISSPQENRFRVVGGVFQQRQTHAIYQDYVIDDLAAALSVPAPAAGNTIWLTDQSRVDRDFAVFGEASYDITEKLTGLVGARYYESKNSLEGFYGYGAGYSSNYGVALCDTPFVTFRTAPCKNLDDTVKDDGIIPKGTLTYRIDPQKLVYGTFSKGFRPGGVNRNGTVPPYKADYLKNYELGWKTTWMNSRVRVNGALFWEDWKDFQFSFIPPGGSGLTVVKNAGQARIKGVEADIAFAATQSLQLSTGFAFIDAKLQENYCPDPDDNGNTVTDCATPDAPKGARLPVSPKFKTNLTARYTFPLLGFDGHAQGALVYQGSSWADLVTSDRDVFGEQAAYALTDFTFGVDKDSYSLELFVNNAFDRRAVLYRYAECATATCGAQPYNVIAQPRTIGIKFGQKF
jgi:outer membrane receptor protein involved in Fe transport